MRVMIARTGLVLSGLTLAGGLSSCGRFLAANPPPEEEWEEVFVFEMQPGTMNPAEAERAIGEQVGMGELVSGTVVHRGSVRAPGGSADFYSYRAVDPDMGTQPMFCTSMIAGSSMSAGCGDQGPVQPTTPLQLNGESWGGYRRSAEFIVQADVVKVEATATDGTVYTVAPLNGFGYIEWPDERGSLELVAYDAQDQELGRAFAGLDR